MTFNVKVRREFKVLAVLAVLFGLIAFTERMKGAVTVREIQITLDNVHENHYLDEKDVLGLMRLDTANLKGANLNKLDFGEIERRIRQSPYVEEAELFSDLKGNLMVNVSLRRPVARMVRNDGPDGYIAEDGTIMPVSDRFTSRVMLISGPFVGTLMTVNNILELEEGKQLMLAINMIMEDPFWNAQIAQIDIDSKTRMDLFVQVGDEKIELGKPENLDLKLRKLKIFYKEILPRVGWNKYNRINVEYEGQVVAE